MIDAIRNKKIKDAENRIIDLIGASTFGYSRWKELSQTLEIKYPSLWSLQVQEQATVDSTYATALTSLYQAGVISAEDAVRELQARKIFVDPNTKAEELE